MKQIPCALTIAGTDPSGGAGIQADLKTFQELQAYGMSVITSVVAQNTTGVQEVHHLPVSMIEEQLDAVISDIPFQAFKTGMIATIEMMEAVSRKVADLNVPFIMDPVMVAKSGDPLIAEEARQYLRETLIPMTTLITPNLPEAEDIIGWKVETTEAMEQAAKQIVHEHGAGAALVKGGHLAGKAVDVLYDGDHINTFTAERIDTGNTHGTGCTYSAAITAYMSKGESLPDAVKMAKDFVTAAIRDSFPLGHGSGPTNHWALRQERVL
ncbi:bifunctional hydroxymethylpyrimidine kinase/phosphomethylpyrimidine kinase [Virgibacillus siamensis]|uniref:bifunctional hydroxymethylpyrimidine kinase/phosphomethylpyrimidine kinase n=1 Tax=Virgibacillus siamensis TaxID=480071 RepID=UPI0009850A02|nr:bifunctional hydroxymethylpyrimidine kinase/phosphomethylpyrimidine kinase [Virgibacillus siamensis]